MDTQHKNQAQAYAERVIKALGETAEVARMCKVSMAAVSQWKENGIPDYRIDFLRLKRPEAFKEIDLESGDPAPDNPQPPTNH